MFGPFNFTKGVLQSIGYKEFHEFYLQLKIEGADYLENNLSLIEYLVEKESMDNLASETRKVFAECKVRLVQSTQKYAKRQLTWMSNRLAGENSLVKNRVFLLEFDSVAKFKEQVIDKALTVLDQYFEGKLPALEFSEKVAQSINDNLVNWKKYYCEDCGYHLNGEKEWAGHPHSKKHKKNVDKKNKRKKNLENMIKYKKIVEPALEEKAKLGDEIQDNNV